MGALASKASPVLAPTWTDLFLWSVLAGRNGAPFSTSLTLRLWGESRFPLRAALIASQLCRRIAPSNPIHRTELLSRSLEFEDWALALLDQISDSEIGQQILILVPQKRNPDAEARRRVFGDSCLDSALEDDGYLSLPCKRVVAHKHSQHCVEQFLAGNYPGSAARIPVESSSMALLCQMALNWVTLFMAPNVFVPTTAPIYEHHEVCTSAGKKITTRTETQAALEELDADDAATQTWDETYFAASRNFRDVIEAIYLKERDDRLRGWLTQASEVIGNRRNFHFVHIPRVKFLTHQVFYAIYMFLPFLFLTHNFLDYTSVQDGGQEIQRRELVGMGLPHHITGYEVLFWIWTVSRFCDEISQIISAPRIWSYFRDAWNQVDVFTQALGLVNICLRLLCYPTFELDVEDLPSGILTDPQTCSQMQKYSRVIYAFITVLIWIRMVQILRIDFELGKLSIILGRMMGKDVLVFLQMQVFISFGFGAAFCILQPGILPPYFIDIWFDLSSPVWMPIWGLVSSQPRTLVSFSPPCNPDWL